MNEAQPDIYLNGQFLRPEEGKISVMDRGFLFGDGVYEVIPCYAGRLFRLEHHLQRLDSSLHAIHMTNPLSTAEWQAILQRLIQQLPGTDQSVYLQITRGSTGKRDHAIPKEIQPTLFAMTQPAIYPDEASLTNGVKAITLQDNRWHRCNIKAITLLANVLLRSEAMDHGASEAILIRDGQAVEGATSNIFIVKKQRIITPPKSEHLLPGITRDLVLELAGQQGMPFEESAISEQALNEADEIWLTSSSKEVMAVVELNGQRVGNGKPGPIYSQIANHYQAYKNLLRKGSTL
ncbi:D-amino acid aminotransferase [Sedimenticola selenatireducens]|jgi:D-alanine transaminase|uniref:Aminodeoxychorismate lyase n=1 Tax=Sedimenticola selenatireducens TaxID=191960 RepID=A0A558DSS5_9GAMM|nr:D-amino acid aminotransferase [Sedimenticola selenatireducens]TVO76585.1 D-amino acid aminotransferase [Sedimenticola selenatireducens]TVT64029.1 MAG: D-amino acid aminotransferase [Sedimenticola selenatireducens]